MKKLRQEKSTIISWRKLISFYQKISRNSPNNDSACPSLNNSQIDKYDKENHTIHFVTRTCKHVHGKHAIAYLLLLFELLKLLFVIYTEKYFLIGIYKETASQTVDL